MDEPRRSKPWWTSTLFIAFIFLPHLGIRPLEPNELGALAYAWQSAGLIFVLVFSKWRIDRFAVFSALLFLSVTISSVAASNSSFPHISWSALLLGVILFTGAFKENANQLVSALAKTLAVVVIANAYTVFISPPIANDEFLLGGKNTVTLTLIPAIVIIWLNLTLRQVRFRALSVAVILLAMATMLELGSGTAIATVGILIALGLIPRRIIPPLWILLCAYAAGTWLIVSKGFGENRFEFIFSALEKDSSFNGRTEIWEYVITLFPTYQWTGLGRQTEIVANRFWNLSETHNGVLQTLTYGGLLALVLLCATLLSLASLTRQAQSPRTEKTVNLAVLSFLMIGLTESIFFESQFWIVLAVASLAPQMAAYPKKVEHMDTVAKPGMQKTATRNESTGKIGVSTGPQWKT